MRRNRIRSSVTSTRSSASDRTITNEFLNLSDDLSPEGSTGGRVSDGKHADPPPPTRNDSVSVRSSNDQSRRHKTPREQKTSSNSTLHTIADESSTAMLDPTYVAQKILAETRPQRQALELMQKWSVDQLQLKRMAGTQNDAGRQNDNAEGDVYNRYPGLRDADDKQTKDCPSSPPGGSTCTASQNVTGVDHRREAKARGVPEETKSDATYANIPPITNCTQPPEQRRAFHRVESGTRNTPGQNTAFRGCITTSSDDGSRSSKAGSDHGSSSTPWLGKTTPSVARPAESRPRGLSDETDASRYTHSTFSPPVPATASKPFTSLCVNVAPPGGSPHTQHNRWTSDGQRSAEELRQPDSRKDPTVKKTAEQVLPPDGQSSSRDTDCSVNVKCPSALKSVHRPNKQKTVKFQDEIETKSPGKDDPPTTHESCDVKRPGNTSTCNGVPEDVTPQTQSTERDIPEVGKSSQIPPVVYKPPPPYPGAGRKLPPPQRTPPSGPVKDGQTDRPGAVVSNGYREHSLDALRNQYNSRVSAANGHADPSHCPSRRGCSDASSPSVNDDMTDLNSRQNLKRMSMHMYTSSDDSTASPAHRLNGVTHKRVTENFQRFQTRPCNGDAVPNPAFTSQPPLGKQNGAPNFVANYIERGDRHRPEERRDYDWECRTRVPVGRPEEASDRTRHSRDPFTLQSSQC